MPSNADRHQRLRLRLWYHAEALLQIILEGPPPADRRMDRYFREHKKLGRNDRGFVAETVYGCLRHLLVLRHIAGEKASYAALVAAELLLQGNPADALRDSRLTGDQHWNLNHLAKRVEQLDPTQLPHHVQANLPTWLFERLSIQIGAQEALQLAHALNQPATLDIRVNTLKTDRPSLQKQLSEEGADMQPTPYSPIGLRREKRAALFNTRAFAEGLFEVQDEGSQLISLLTEAMRKEMAIDFCAGGGGKTLAMGAMMQASGTLYACDVHDRRLKEIKPRLARAGLSNVRTVVIDNERDPRIMRLKGKMHRVLVDAPCSGTGTLRRNPDIKWRNIDFDELTALQARILESAARLVRPGGRLVYATCSLLDEENGAIVRNFLAQHPEFELLSAKDILLRQGADVPLDDEMMRLYPHRHGTDGFFAAAMQRKEL